MLTLLSRRFTIGLGVPFRATVRDLVAGRIGIAPWPRHGAPGAAPSSIITRPCRASGGMRR